MTTPRTTDRAVGRPPNLVVILSDDHAAHAISAYGSTINQTPNLDRIASTGARFSHCFCANSICTPSRATILTGAHSHVTGVTTLATDLDNRRPTFVSALHDAGYQTAVFGKWHLGHGPDHDPRGFDEWKVLPGQGDYHDPVFLTADGEQQTTGYVTDLITDFALDWLDRRDPERPFCLLVHHKAPHRWWEPDEAHASLFADDVPEPATLFDDHHGRSDAVRRVKMTMEDLDERDLKGPVPDGLDPVAERRWRYQAYIKDYLRVVASMDDNVGRLLDHLDARGLTDDTVVGYASDQGFFLGDHGWFDKRLIYEESLRMPLLVRWPGVTRPGSTVDRLVTNVDFAQTFCEIAQVAPPDDVQGWSLVPLLRGEDPADWPTEVYYRYWMHADPIHDVPAHYGLRTERYKIVCYWADDDTPDVHPEGTPVRTEWELYDLVDDPHELRNVVGDPALRPVVEDLVRRLAEAQESVGDRAWPGDRAGLGVLA